MTTDMQTTEPSAGVRWPDFLYIGTSKAGSTWIYNVLASHREVFLAPGKGTYFFDQHFDRGLEWYRQQFASAGAPQVWGEISHSYLSSPPAAQRIAELVPSVKLVVCLREPVERAFSAYLDSVKNGRFQGSFEQALESIPSLLQRGAYAQHIDRYLALFPREQLHVAVFDDLKSQPQQFSDALCDFLGVSRRPLAKADLQKQMPAAVARSQTLTLWAKRSAKAVEKLGFTRLRGRVKRSRMVRNLLYRPLKSRELPSIQSATWERYRRHFREEIRQLDDRLGLDLQTRWQYD